MHPLRTLLILAALLGGMPLPAPAAGQSDTPAATNGTAQLEQWDKEASAIEKALAAGYVPAWDIGADRRTLEAQRAAIPALVSAAQAELDPLKKQLDALGPAPEPPQSEAPDIAAQRKQLSDRITAIEARSRRLAQVDARASALLAQLSELQRARFTRELMTRGPSPFDPETMSQGAASIGDLGAAIVTETADRVKASTLGLGFVARILFPFVLIGVALILMTRVKPAVMRRLVPAPGTQIPFRRRVTAGVAATLVRLVMPAIALAMVIFAIWNSGLLGAQSESLLFGLAGAAGVVIAAYAIGGAFYAPHAPELRISVLPEAEAEAAHRWLMAMAAVVGLDRVLVVRGEALGLSIEALDVLNAGLLIFGGAALYGFAGYLRERRTPKAAVKVPAPDEDGLEPERQRDSLLGPTLRVLARLAARVVAIAAPTLALFGYFAASRFTFYPAVFSAAVIGVCMLLFHVVRDSVDRIVSPAEAEAHESRSRIRLIPVAVGFLLICAAVPVLALIWGADTGDLVSTWRTVSGGFAVGSFVISPFEFISFLLVFAIGYVFTRILQGVLSRSVLPFTGLDEGAKAAIAAGTFYIGVSLSALVAISATGLDLSNLAIVAGALSVGIGFGLQNIVNNFVSGIILLIERPIKAGDWVELASGMGYVKQVNVRSTEIETFDRASLIVPNSELISGPVTNWTHNNLNGRLIVPIGVAYGTDPRKVEAILTEIARAQPMLLRRPAPYVLFRRFGADALEFEIRGVLRDVNWILNVTSDINFEIARRFAEAGIEIPFAQRDLHLRNAGELGQSIGDAIRGSAPRAGATPPAAPVTRLPRRRSEAAGDDPDGDS